MGTRGNWRSGDVVAWTEHDGVGAPPKGPGRVLPLVLAGTLAVILAGMLSTDTLCPEHRAWVIALGTAGIICTAVCIVGLVQSWALAPVLTVFVALDGVAIGLIDALHDPARGRMIALGFALVAVLASALTAQAARLSMWERHVRRQLAPAEPAPRREVPAPAPEARAAAPEPEGAPTSLG
jgi:hypothetical protein